MKKLLKYSVYTLVLLLICSQVSLHKSDAYIRDRVLLLHNSQGSCSAVEVKSPLGKVYTLSAAHCSDLAVNGYIEGQDEKGDSKPLKIIKIDFAHDLLLLEGFDDKSVNVAGSIKIHDIVYTITHGHGHGHGMPSYRTDGELLMEDEITIEAPLFDEESITDCGKKKNHELVLGEYGYACRFKYNIVYSTASVIPGSSGGPALNEYGDLIGIVSATDGFFSALIPLADVQAFLKGM